MRRRLLTTALISAFILSACGVKGDLQTPPPLWGDKAKQDQPVQAQDSDPESDKDDDQD